MSHHLTTASEAADKAQSALLAEEDKTLQAILDVMRKHARGLYPEGTVFLETATKGSKMKDRGVEEVEGREGKFRCYDTVIKIRAFVPVDKS